MSHHQCSQPLPCQIQAGLLHVVGVVDAYFVPHHHICTFEEVPDIPIRISNHNPHIFRLGCEGKHLQNLKLLPSLRSINHNQFLIPLNKHKTQFLSKTHQRQLIRRTSLQTTYVLVQHRSHIVTNNQGIYRIEHFLPLFDLLTILRSSVDNIFNLLLVLAEKM